MEFVNYKVSDGVAVLTLNRPGKLNAFSAAMWEEYKSATAAFSADPEARVLVLQGAGRAFTAGRDLSEEADGGEPPESHYDEDFNIFAVPDTDKPIICAVQGYAVGAGWYMVAGCDIRIAAHGTKFAVPELRTGLLGPYILSAAESLPWPMAFEFAIGDFVDASVLHRLGLLNELVDAENLHERALEWALRLLKLPPVHLQQTKRLMRKLRVTPSLELLDDEIQTRLRLNQLDDTKEAVLAFADKRKPNFTGR